MDNVRAVALLAARVLVGVVFILHGKLKLSHADLGPKAFEQYDIPLPEVAFWFTSLAEVIGGTAFVIGLALPFVGALFAFLTLGALYFVHRPNGFWAESGGYEFVLVLAFVSVALGLTANRWSLDALIMARRERGPATAVPAGRR